MLKRPEPKDMQGRSEGTSGKGRWGQEQEAHVGNDRLAGRCHQPCAPTDAVAARKGAANGVLFGLLVIWVFIFQTSSSHGTNESRHGSPCTKACWHSPGSHIQHKPSCSPLRAQSHLSPAFHQVTFQPDHYHQLSPHSSPPWGHSYRHRHGDVQGRALGSRQGGCPVSGWCRLCHIKAFLKLKYGGLRVGVNH